MASQSILEGGLSISVSEPEGVDRPGRSADSGSSRRISESVGTRIDIGCRIGVEVLMLATELASFAGGASREVERKQPILRN